MIELLVVIHNFFNNRYAYRHGLTDVVVQHLLTEEKGRLYFLLHFVFPYTSVHLRCRDMVKKIAVYKNRLAVRLTCAIFC